jgi:hypothetical protein
MPSTYLCTLIPHYYELSVTYLQNRSLWVCLHWPVDDDIVRKRDDTLEYVSGQVEEDELVIVVFGMDIGLYGWQGKGPGRERLSGLRVHYED